MEDGLKAVPVEERDERLVTTEDLIQENFGAVLNALSSICGLKLNPSAIAAFCDNQKINSPKQFVCQLIDLLMQRLREKIDSPSVTYFRMPNWLDMIVQRVANDFKTPDELKSMIPDMPEIRVKTREYEILAYGFLKETVSL